MARNRLACLVFTMALLSSLPALALEELELAAYAEARTIEVVTKDEDGSLRETTIWIAVVDGAAYINTNATTWGENVERTPRLEVRQGDSTRTFDILFLTDAEARHKVQEAFRKKYGFQDKLIGFFMDESKATIMQLVDWMEEAR